MESIEEEDENQMHNDKKKMQNEVSNQDSLGAFNTQTYVSVTPTPPKNETRKGS